MKTCPRCYEEFPDSNRFCPKDGVTLIPIAGAHSVGAAAAMPARETTTYLAAPPQPEPAAGPFPPAFVAYTPDLNEQVAVGTTPIKGAKRSLFPLVAIGAVTIFAVAIVTYVNFPSAKRSIMAEIRKGHLVTSDGSSAYDIYLSEKSKLSREDLAEIAGEAVPAAENRANQILARLKNDGNDSEAEWAEAGRLYGWLNDIKPNPAYESRKSFSQGRLKFLKKDYSGSIPEYQRSIQLDTGWALPFNGLGRAYVNSKDRENARENYRRATEVEPGWIIPYLNLGALCIDMNDYKAAEDYLKQALRIDANKATAYYLLGQAYEKTERWCDAISNYRQAVSKPTGGSSPGFAIDTLKARLDRLTAKYHCG